MSIKNILFILSLLGILLLLFLLNFFGDNAISGYVKKIEYGNNKISLFLEDSNTEFIVFSNIILNIREGEKITINFKKEEGISNQGIVSKIII